MSKVLAIAAAALIVLLSFAGQAWYFVRISNEKASAVSALATAKQVNQANATALQQLQADRLKDQQQVADLNAQLKQVQAQRQATKTAMAKVIDNAPLEDQKLLNSRLPAAVLRLLPSADPTPGANPAGAAEPSG